MDNQVIGQRIKERRKELKIKQIQVQEACGISSGNLSGIETGRYLPSAAALVELAKILDCSIDWILTGNASTSKNESFVDIKDNSEKELLTYFRNLSDNDKEELLVLAKIKYEHMQTTKEKKATSSQSNNGIIADETA